MAASATDIEEFLKGPLVKWVQQFEPGLIRSRLFSRLTQATRHTIYIHYNLDNGLEDDREGSLPDPIQGTYCTCKAGARTLGLSTCIKRPESLEVYETFFDGSAIYEVLLQIDPEPIMPVPVKNNTLDLNTIRIRTFYNIIKSIKSIYEDELRQIVISLPDCIVLGQTPRTEAALSNLKLLMLLLLGCAVQGPTKEIFIGRIKDLNVEMQHDIVQCIKRVTDEQNIVLTLDWTEQSAEKLFGHVKSLTEQRDKFCEYWVGSISQETKYSDKEKNGTDRKSDKDGADSNHWAVELADWKSKFRKQRQELEEKTEILAECKEELEHANDLLRKMKSENKDFIAEARKAKAYRDEMDSIRERAERTDRLEIEVQRYRERLADAEFYKARVDELREDNRVLLETREMLESQLARARQRADLVLELEAELLDSKQKNNETMLERDAALDKIQELIDENLQLQQVTKSALQETSLSNVTLDSDFEETTSGDNSLSEQLTSNAQARALRLELENKKLLDKLEALKEDGFHDNAGKVLELNKDKKKLLIKNEQLQKTCDKLKQQNAELETMFKDAIQENRKIQTSLDTLKITSDRNAQEFQNEKQKLTDLEITIENLTKEKQRMQTLFDTVKKRADDAEKVLADLSKQVKNLETEVEEGKKAKYLVIKLQDSVINLEKENSNSQKEIEKLREILEAKDVNIDKFVTEKTVSKKEIERINQENSDLIIKIAKLQEYEHKYTELDSQRSVIAETLATLQKNLINEKVSNEKMKNFLERLGVNNEVLDSDFNIIVEKVLEHPEIYKLAQSIFKASEAQAPCNMCHLEGDALRQAEEVAKSVSQEWSQQCDKLYSDIAALQSLNDCLQNENATLQVDISTCKSQVQSLQTQQCTLQLTNNQLVVEKEELIRKQQLQNAKHDTLLLDQVTLRTLHEQLSSEYEELKIQLETAKTTNRDLKLEIRTLKETVDNLNATISGFEMEKESLKKDAGNLTNLRNEHSKLKDDFRNLFTASERLKVEYRNVQEELKTLRTESRTLRLGNTEMQGDLNTTLDKMSILQVDNARLQQKCDMLFEMNHSLDSDRRALMEHVSQLLSQYHSLLTHSLEDKEHFHLEEKQFSDKMNNLCRQKEKLEEKIMEHYKKLDNASAKKRGFGANLVRRVRKAGSDIINKVPPNRNRRSWQEDSSHSSVQPNFILVGGSGESVENDSDNSNEDVLSQQSNVKHFKRNTSETGSLRGLKPKDKVALRKSYRDLSSHRNSFTEEQVLSSPKEPPLSLGSVGSRRTVYLSEEDGTSVNVVKPVLNPPLLVYNRISTVIGEPQIQTRPSTPQRNNNGSPQPSNLSNAAEDLPNEEKKKDAKETAVWYEYGCV